MRVGADGIVNVVAGTGINFSSGDGGLAINACLTNPTAIALDVQGNLYIAEMAGFIRKVTPDGIIATIAGTGVVGFGGDNGPAIDAQFGQISGLAVDAAGNLYVADRINSNVRKITADGNITTFAGNGQSGSSGDNGPATAASLNLLARIVLDPAGNLYILQASSVAGANPDNRVRKVDTHGIITTVAGGGSLTGDGIAATAASLFPVGIAIDASGNLYIADAQTYGIRKVDTQGKIATIAGGSGKKGFAGDGGNALNARFYFKNSSLAFDTAGNLLIADDVNQRIRRLTPGGVIGTIAGNGGFHSSGNGGPAISASLDYPTGILADGAGNIYITEPILSRIRRITPDGNINIFAGRGIQDYSGDNGLATAAGLGYPTALALDAKGSLYFSDGFAHVIRKIDQNGIITTVAGNGSLGFAGDGGPALQAQFAAPFGIDFDSAGNLIVADTFNNRIRAVTPGGTVSTIAGSTTAGFQGDNGPALEAQLNQPLGLRVYKGAIYFADQANNRIRRIDLATHLITTVAGNGTGAFAGDGGQATQASLNAPVSIGFDPSGNMYIADTGNGAVRIVSPDGTIDTFAGSPPNFFPVDGGLATDSGLRTPVDVSVDTKGNVLIADQANGQIRAVLAAAPSFRAAPASLAFTAPAGSSPTDQSLDLIGSISGLGFTATATSSGWLQTSSASGPMPTTLRITADPSALAPGPYQGTITVTAPLAKPSAQIIPITLTVTAPGQPSLDVKPKAMVFSFVSGGAAVSRPMSVTNAGGGSLPFTIATATNSGGSWLNASPSAASLNAFASSTINITANPAGLASGTYTGLITVSSASPAQSVTVPVTITVTAVQQTILIPQTGLTFVTVQDGGFPPPQFFSILNNGVGQMPFTVTSSTLSGGDWLFNFPGNGVSDAASDIVPQVRIDIDPTGLKAGIYYGTVQVSAPGADNNPQFVSVILNVLPPGSNIGALVQPTGLVFAAVEGKDSPNAQSVLVQNTGSTPLTFTSGHLTLDGKDWFKTLPGVGAVTAAQPVRIVVQPNIQGLARGVYRGTLTLSFSDGNTRTVALVLVIVPPGTTPQGSNSRQAGLGSCKPATLAPVFTLLSSGFTLPAGFPGQVAVKVIDDCATPMTSGGVTVSFSNGDSPIRLTSLKDGSWAGTWTPVNSTSEVTVSANAAIPEQSLKGSTQIKGSLQASNATPLIGAGAILNGASYALQAPLAPGTLVAIFGSALADGSASAPAVPLPTTLAGSSIVLAGRQAPLMYASGGQVNAMIPYGIAVNTSQQVAASRGSSISVPQQITVASAAPGIFTVDGSGKGQGIIVGVKANGDQAVADPSHPVSAGDVLVIYCTGLGEVNPPLIAGNAASLTQLEYAVSPATVTIGGVQAPVLFAGLTPAYVGLYQVNATVPPGITPGDTVPVVMTAAGQVSAPVTISVR
ncbi:MAG TPA: hypothetical protein VEU96_28865 [Bryobacteraceae bacterium]|nr:hypothetical protein [Bryobacteraceae bacterium]